MRRLAPAVLLCLACGAPNGTVDGTSTSEVSTTSGGSTSTPTPTTSGDTGSPSSGGGSSGSGEASAADSSGGSSEDTGEPFVPDCHTRLTRTQRLAFVCNIPSALADCVAGVCEDVDADGLTDAWEDLLLAAMRPLRRMDEAETGLADPTMVFGDVGRVAAVADHFRVFVMLGYSIDYGSCGFTGHNGDSERVALDLVADPEGGPGGVVVVGAYTAAHENTASDHGALFTGDSLAQLVYAVDLQTTHPRWVVYPSADKHATYATIDICENISPIPCLDEDCGPDDVDDPAKFDVLPAWVNAGELAAPRVDELAVVGFPGEQAWTDQDFCGGLGGDGCSSPVRDKLIVDPF